MKVIDPHGDPAEKALQSNLPSKPRRRRRSGEDVAHRIREAARELFGERGYVATTTKEIARRAQVSETLLFRHYGDKAGLFSEVVAAPFRRLIERADTFTPGIAAPNSTRLQAEQLTEDVFKLFEQNSALFRALLVESLVDGKAQGAPELAGLLPFFDISIERIRQLYAQANQTPPIDFEVGVRLGFAMVMSSVLMPEILFPEPPARAKMLATLKYMVTRTLAGPEPC